MVLYLHRRLSTQARSRVGSLPDSAVGLEFGPRFISGIDFDCPVGGVGLQRFVTDPGVLRPSGVDNLPVLRAAAAGYDERFAPPDFVNDHASGSMGDDKGVTARTPDAFQPITAGHLTRFGPGEPLARANSEHHGGHENSRDNDDHVCSRPVAQPGCNIIRGDGGFQIVDVAQPQIVSFGDAGSYFPPALLNSSAAKTNSSMLWASISALRTMIRTLSRASTLSVFSVASASAASNIAPNGSRKVW